MKFFQQSPKMYISKTQILKSKFLIVTLFLSAIHEDKAFKNFKLTVGHFNEVCTEAKGR